MTGKPRESPHNRMVIVVTSSAKYCSACVHHFRAKVFMNRNFAGFVLDNMNTKCNETKAGIGNTSKNNKYLASQDHHHSVRTLSLPFSLYQVFLSIKS